MMDIGISPQFFREVLETAGTKTWAIVKILIFFFVVRAIAYRLIARTVKTLASRQRGMAAEAVAGRLFTLDTLVRSIVFYVLVFITGVMLLRVFDINATPVLTAAGVVGLAVGFGAQRLVRDVISGFFLVLENQYTVGEFVTIGAVTGVIENLGMRTTQIRDEAGRLIITANGDIVQVVNHSRGPVQAVLDVSVASDSDLDKVRSLVDEAGKKVAQSVEGVVTPPKALGISALDGNKVTIRVSGEVKPGRQEAVQAALREQIRSSLSSGGVTLV